MSDRGPLFDFFVAHAPKKEMYAHDAAYSQRNYFERLVALGDHIVKGASGTCTAAVIGDHCSKSVVLPVAELRFSTGAVLTLRGNFYNYVVSAVCPLSDVPASWLADIASKDKINAVYCEGFPDDKVYDAHSANPRRFTFKVSDNDTLSFFVISFAKLQKELLQADLPPMELADLSVKSKRTTEPVRLKRKL